jgi:hypothetical protein
MPEDPTAEVVATAGRERFLGGSRPMRFRLIANNPADLVQPPRLARREMRALTLRNQDPRMLSNIAAAASDSTLR